MFRHPSWQQQTLDSWKDLINYGLVDGFVWIDEVMHDALKQIGGWIGGYMHGWMSGWMHS